MKRMQIVVGFVFYVMAHSFLGAVVVISGTSEVLVSWDTDGIGEHGPSPWDETSSLGLGIRLERGLSRGIGVDTGGTGADSVWGGRGFNAGTFEDAIAAEQFVYFTIAPEEGFAFSLMGIDQTFRRSGTGPVDFQWQYQIGEEGSFVSIGSPWQYTGSESNGAVQPIVDLAGISDLQEVSSSVTLRLVAWGGGNTGTWGLGRLAGDDLVVYGTVIPEPMAYAAWFGATVLMITLIRRRKTGRVFQ